MDIFASIDEFFETYKFAQECILIFLSVILGGICTVFINKGAMRKQCQFNMQHEILSDAMNQVTVFQKELMFRKPWYRRVWKNMSPNLGFI